MLSTDKVVFMKERFLKDWMILATYWNKIGAADKVGNLKREYIHQTCK